MLAQLRQQTKIVLWIVVVGFVGFMFFDWGMNRVNPGSERAGLAGKVGKDRITSEEFRQEYRNQRAAYYQQYEVNPTVQTEQEVADRTWETLVQRHLLWEEALDEHLIPSDDEVLLEIQNNPPPFITAQPIFQTDSVFDQSKYLAALSDPNLDLRFLEEYVRSNLPYQKLRDYAASSVRLTKAEARTLLDVFQSQSSISYIKVDPLSHVRETVPEPGEQEIAAYYTSHQEDFRIPEKRILAYARVLKVPGAEDRMYARTKIEDAHSLVQAGEPFDEIAMHYSEDAASSATGGDLGWVRPGRLAAALDSVAGTLEIGQTSDIIETEDGFHILRLDDRRQEDGSEEWKLSYILSRLQASPLTVENIREDVFELVDKARTDGFQEAAEERGFETAMSQELVETQIAPVLGLTQDEAGRIFETEQGLVLGPLDGRDAIYAVMVAEIIPTRIPPMAEIEAFVKQSYTRDIRTQKAGAIAEDALGLVRGGKTLEQVASEMDLTFQETQPFTRMAFVPGIGKENVVVANAFALEEGRTSGVLEHSGQFFIIRVDEKTPADEESLADDVANLWLSLIASKQQAYLSAWYEALRSQVEIEDYRSLGQY
jgi:peptidyl-prolyl cis-trans isomerase D